MACKNCLKPLDKEHNYCASCGAKVIHNRLTFQNLWSDWVETFLNVDNTLLKTFLHLFTQPEVVIEGYIAGVRKRYMNPVSYMAIALTLTGIMVFFMKRTFPDGIDFNQFGQQVYTAAASKKLTDLIFTFYSLISLFFLPILAGSALLVFSQKKYLFTEYIICFIYVQAQFSLFTFPVIILILFVAPERYMNFSFFSLLLMIGYALYVMKRISNLKIGAFLFRSFVFLLLFGFAYLLFGILQAILVFLTGVLSIEDFIIKK
jgi:hypothetical protein